MNHITTLLLILSASVAQADVLRVYNWIDYIDPLVISDFTRQTGIAVDYREYHSAEELEAALDRGESFDLVAPSHFQMENLIKEGKLQRIDRNQIDRFDTIDVLLQGALASFNGANDYAVPYLWSSVGIVYDRDQFQKRGLEHPDSLMYLFEPSQLSRSKACGVGWIDAPIEVFSLYSNLIGKQLDRLPSRRINKMGGKLADVRSMVNTINNAEYTNQLMNGELCLSLAWSGHARLAASQRTSLSYHVAAEGGVIAIDSWAIPKNAKNAEQAHQFINFMLAPENAVRNSAATFFYSPLAPEMLTDKVLSSTTVKVLPDDDERSRLYMAEHLSEKQLSALEEAWADVVFGDSEPVAH